MGIIVKSVVLLAVWISTITIANAQNNLIPTPSQLVLGNGNLDLSQGIFIKITNKSLKHEYGLLTDIFKSWGVGSVKETRAKLIPTVILSVQPNFQGKDEAYNLLINSNEINITARTNKGLFYGLQTLKQFTVKDKQIQYASIQDEPAFSWRAYLIDVGRNFQSVDMIKEQIDVMAQYKLNVLHFHFTEDIAWRLQSDKYPGLTDASVMTRWKGDYYTKNDLKDLIQYCKERHITFLPEIDMPGHSAAFKRFFGVDMQSDSGMMYIKELLSEFRQNFPELDIFHIGGDEVKITNKNFMPEITKFVEGLGYKKTIGWDPGSNLEPQTIRQMWMGGPKLIEEKGNFVYIESKHLYINHMDPLETVTTLFHRKIGEVDNEHKNLIGATLCSWPDRAVGKSIDMFSHSAIYPAILTFAERIWQGGGRAGWVANIVSEDEENYNDFVAFEQRLLNHKKLYFADKPFPYVSQLGTKWELIGPFENMGDVNKSFEIEKNPFAQLEISKIVEGGTVVLKHWFGDIIEGAIKNPTKNTTYYARTKIWSDTDAVKPFWVDFNNLSRSYLTDTPELDTWDNKGSQAYVNGVRIVPPNWKNAGQQGQSQVPLVDEGYSYRAPTMIKLKKGWNEVLLKLPVAEFRGRTWENPSKWIFTFVPVAEN
ncbi:family 20 glycosylhydrolase [Sphingobacterium bovistauri]|uniref:beta-N-acetylhexosaminidase n=1 Tax=Sphingobacterium bovistauri TaxID=2781959 RepID=A0ABS7Z529_9SPHI|nr:family 20 glycosylhydrolase [Sphingobacterium bovistauri]MCA5005303.1 beta-N-acetylhexosaminidase [Sphingobacterium bovistauri]